MYTHARICMYVHICIYTHTLSSWKCCILGKVPQEFTCNLLFCVFCNFILLRRVFESTCWPPPPAHWRPAANRHTTYFFKKHCRPVCQPWPSDELLPCPHPDHHKGRENMKWLSLPELRRVGSIFGAILFGYLTDEYGRKRLFIITMLLYIFGARDLFAAQILLERLFFCGALELLFTARSTAWGMVLSFFFKGWRSCSREFLSDV